MRKAVILAAGEGRRLEPLTNLRPKPMLPVANRPLLEYVVNAVADAGIKEIVLVVGYKRDRIQTHFGDGEDWDLEIDYAVQNKQLGTGHAILQAEEHVDGQFIVLNGDRIIDADLVERLADKQAEADGAIMAVTTADEPTEYGVVELSSGRVVSLIEKPSTIQTESGLINAGVYGFEKSIFEQIRSTETGPDGELAITRTLERLVAEDEVHAVHSRGMWIDVSHLWDVLTVNAKVLDRSEIGSHEEAQIDAGATVAEEVLVGRDCHIGPNATVLRGTAIDDNVSIGANAVVVNSVVLADSSIGEGSVVKDCVVAGNVHVGANVTIEGGDGDVVIDGTYHDQVKLGGVIGDNSWIGAAAVIDPGTIIGDGAHVEPGCRLDGSVPPNVEVRRG